MAGKQNKKQPERPAYEAAWEKVQSGMLRDLAWKVYLRPGKPGQMARDDWACVTSQGELVLNHARSGTVGEWEYVLTHCLLHLGMDHFRRERMDDLAWLAACDLLVTDFLRSSHTGTPPPEFQRTPPFPVKSEEQAYSYLKEHPELLATCGFSTMAHGRPDMVWAGEPPRTPFQKLFAQSLQNAIQDALRSSSRLGEGMGRWRPDYLQARDWFLSSYPLLGALASSFTIVDDRDTVRRMGIPVAAVNCQLRELYITPECRLYLEGWKFILAHEFLHAALRHDVRRQDRDPVLWNVACDFVVNDWLLEMNVGAMPDFALHDPVFRGLSVEGVYDQVCQDARFYTGRDPKDLLYGDEGWWDTLEGSEVDEYYRSAIYQGLEYHTRQGRGFLPAGLVEEIRAVSRPPIPWDVELARWFDEQFAPMEKHRSYARLSRRQSATPDIPRPAWRAEPDVEHQRIFGVVLDTSGSMDRQLLAAALGSIASYSQARDVHHVRVVFCDAAPYDQGVMHPEDIAGAVQVRGRGGTKLQPGIDLLEHDPAFPKDAPLLIITDGACDRLQLHGRGHAYLIPWGNRLPFPPRGPVFELK